MATWHDTASAAEYLRVGPDKIRDATNAGLLRAKRTSESRTAPFRYREEWLDEYAEEVWPEN